MWVLLSLIITMMSWPAQSVGGAENAPPPSVPPSSQVPTPEPVPPPLEDPGIVKKPDVEPLPGSVVVPPVVDPKIAVNPEEPRPQEPAAPRERDQQPRSQEQSR